MHPVLVVLPIGEGFALHVYGLMGALGFLAAMTFVLREAQRAGLDQEKIVNLCLGALLAGVVGSRLLFVALNWDIFSGDLASILNLRDGGLVFLGGVVLAMCFSAVYTHRAGISVWRAGDVILPGLALGHAFGRIGCLSAGCCYGRATTLPWGIQFDPTSVGPTDLGQHYHPVQVYESSTDIALFLLLVYVLRHKRFDGQVFLLYFGLYTILRFAHEFLRGDVLERGYFLPEVLGPVLSTSQGISLLLVVPAILLYRWRRAQAPLRPA